MTIAASTSRFWDPVVHSETRADGSVLVWQEAALDAYPRCLNERFMHWARTTPDRVWMAERGPDGDWVRMTYAEAAERIRSIGSALLARGLSPQNPLVILSGNSIPHALMALGAQHVGVPSAALTPAYALSGGDYGKLRDIAGQLTPGMIFAQDADPFAPAILEVFGTDLPVVSLTGAVEGCETLAFDDLCATGHTAEMEAAFQALDHDTVAKFLFTSGTTGSPKAVIQTQRMICSNPQCDAQLYLYMQDQPPVIVDWAPWNHTAAGNRTFHMALYLGGTYYIDDGKPTPRDIGKTIRNLREVAPTWYFNVPLGFQMLLDAMETDEALRTNFFSRLGMMFYAGAGMSQPVWDRLTRVAEEAVPGGVPLTTGFGTTETGPSVTIWHRSNRRAGNVGIPVPGVTFKLAPVGDKFEGRIKGPGITPGYWRNARLTEEAFDEEGYYRTGDAFKFWEGTDASKGFAFDGRLAENFKLATGTWVAVGALRAQLTNDLRGLASDCVIAGENHHELGALVVPDWDAMRALVGEHLEGEALLSHPSVRGHAIALLKDHAARATGSATRVVRLMFLDVPLSFDKGEVTDKGSINQRAVLRHRADLVEQLWTDDPRVIHLASQAAS